MAVDRIRSGSAVVVLASALLAGVAFAGAARALQTGVALPSGSFRHAAIRIEAFCTRCPDCPPNTLRPLETDVTATQYYVVWSIDETPTADQPYGWTARRLLIVALPG